MAREHESDLIHVAAFEALGHVGQRTHDAELARFIAEFTFSRNEPDVLRATAYFALLLVIEEEDRNSDDDSYSADDTDPPNANDVIPMLLSEQTVKAGVHWPTVKKYR